MINYKREDVIFKKFVDENGSILSQKYEPCGYDGLGNHRTIDDLISETLGIPLVD